MHLAAQRADRGADASPVTKAYASPPFTNTSGTASGSASSARAAVVTPAPRHRPLPVGRHLELVRSEPAVEPEAEAALV